jgi:iron complex outermembrane receptor protein
MQLRSGFATATIQYIGSSFSRFENEEDGFGSIGGPSPTAAPLFPCGGPAFYINNLWDETARLALDYERGRSARVGYITSQPRTFGLYGHVTF